MTTQIKLPTEKIAAFCRQHHIRKLALFGSVLREDFAPDSDVDVLINFEPGVEETLTLMDLTGMQIELSKLLQREVDLVLRNGLKPFLEEEIVSKAEVVYAV